MREGVKTGRIWSLWDIDRDIPDPGGACREVPRSGMGPVWLCVVFTLVIPSALLSGARAWCRVSQPCGEAPSTIPQRQG